ncbi:hypothetical protein [Methylobacterium aquaticum]|uniref:Uncharacterized protein n=1 Tax=Methylobacterium aquaticum TaxID=270351 RepID=A0A0C6G142_9HYPH|nr:hypothetical protein [Methylobacterium aquaticum]BAQ49540.1 hypothetical protein Maq22A_1p36715 [Methylobacterium aquaticum]
MSLPELVLWLSTGLLLLMVALVGVVAALDWALPRRDFDLDRFLAEAQMSSTKDTLR